jgi:hypothetical protein
VPPIKIELDDFGTSQRLTELRRAEAWLSGLYLSFDIWQRLFAFDDGSWHAAIYGEFADNLVAISIEPHLLRPRPPRAFVLSAEAVRLGNVSPRVATAGFYALDAEILAVLGFKNYEEICIAPGQGIRQCFQLHDDFLFFLEPIDGALLRRAVQLAVSVHEHYLGLHLAAPQNQAVAEIIEGMLVRQGAIVLRSEPGSRTIEVTYEVRAGRCWRRLLGIKDKALSKITLPS